MSIFDRAKNKTLEKQNEEQRINEFMKKLNEKIDNTTAEQAKEDLRLMLIALVGFAAKENPKLFSEGKEEGWYVKEFLKTIVGAGSSAMFGGAEDKFKDFLYLFPVIQRYANLKD